MPAKPDTAKSVATNATSEMRRRRVANHVAMSTAGDGQVTQTSTGNEQPSGTVVEPIHVTMASGWRCAQATMIVFVVLNVVLALWIVVELTNLRRDVTTLVANGTTIESSGSGGSGSGVAPRLDTMMRMAEVTTDAFRKRSE